MLKINTLSLLRLLSSATIAQTCDTNINPTTPSTNFTIYNNRTVSDT
jgi:hypothetical protein